MKTKPASSGFFITRRGRTYRVITMKFLPLLLLLVSCASDPLTQEQIEEREYEEVERASAYLMWEAKCKADGNIIFVYNPTRLCRKRDCIPSQWDWRYDFEKERPKSGNSYQCVTSGQIRSILNHF